eukprot:XP_001699074.1 predicted protein [Chlamydomonas reinhardtii]
MTVSAPPYYPETVVFVLDCAVDVGIEYSKSVQRLELIKGCIAMFAQAKSRVNPHHKYGLAVIRVRVILVYCRSSCLPVWTSCRGPADPGLALDVDAADELSGRCGHAAYIFEAGGHLVKKSYQPPPYQPPNLMDFTLPIPPPAAEVLLPLNWHGPPSSCSAQIKVS